MIGDATCYTGCTPTTTGIALSPPAHAVSVPPVAHHGLALTGASIEVTVVVAAALVAIGIALFMWAHARRTG